MVVVNLDELSETYALPGVPPSPPSLGQVQTSQRWVVEGRRDSADPGGKPLRELRIAISLASYHPYPTVEVAL